MITAVLDGELIPWRRWGRSIPRGSPARRAAARRLWEARVRRHQIHASILVGAANIGFNPKLVLYVTATTTSTETVPSGSTTLINEAWGGGGNGGQNASGTNRGGGGGGGAYSLTTFACSQKWGKTLIVAVANTAVDQQTTGGSTVTSGSFAISLITAGSGTGGTSAVTTAGPGAGGVASNANAGATNVNGNSGTAGGGGVQAQGGAGIAGNITGDGGPYGTGGASSTPGMPGAVVFYYT